MFEAIARGEIKALWVIGTNPAVSLPDADAVRAALKKLELFVVSENVRSNDTVNAGAHVLLPAQAWGEKSGTVTNSERRISRQRAFLTAAGRSQAGLVDRQRSRQATRLWRGVRLQIGGGCIPRACRAVGVRKQRQPRFRYRRVERRCRTRRSMRWRRCNGRCACGDIEPQRAFSPTADFMPTTARRASSRRKFRRCEPRPRRGRPLRLNTGRIRDQWHTMTRTGVSPRLGQHLPEPFVEIHPDDADRFGVADGGFARVITDYGQCILKVVVSERQQRGMLFAPIHWSEANASAARVGALVAPFTDPFSGQPENKATPASIVPYEYVFRGFALSRSKLESARRMSGGRGWRSPAATAICSPTTPISARWQSWLRSVAGDDLAEYRDFGGGVYRAASFAGGPHRDLPVRRSRARRRRLGRGEEPVRRRGAQRRPAPDAAVGQIDRRPGQRRARSSAPVSASAAPRSAMRSRRARARPPRSARSSRPAPIAARAFRN